MFHLLVSYSGWPEGRGSISTGRIYIRPNVEVEQAFLNVDGSLNINKIREIPALLVTETGGAGPQIARVAYITAVGGNNRETEIQYAVDNSLPTISNRDLELFSNQLGLGRFGLTHSCWSINQTDLFKLLLTNERRNAINPKVFSVADMNRIEENLVSVMMPFSAEFNAVYTAIQAGATEVGMNCLRADNIWEHHAVIQDVVSLIARARVVVCDCTGRNANVFYEAGIAHTLGKDVILLTQQQGDIPFDLQHLRYIPYLNNNEGLARMSGQLSGRLRTLLSA